MPKKMTPKSQPNLKPHFHDTHFVNTFSTKKASCKQIYDFKF